MAGPGPLLADAGGSATRCATEQAAAQPRQRTGLKLKIKFGGAKRGVQLLEPPADPAGALASLGLPEAAWLAPAKPEWIALRRAPVAVEPPASREAPQAAEQPLPPPEPEPCAVPEARQAAASPAAAPAASKAPAASGSPAAAGHTAAAPAGREAPASPKAAASPKAVGSALAAAAGPQAAAGCKQASGAAAREASLPPRQQRGVAEGGMATAAPGASAPEAQPEAKAQPAAEPAAKAAAPAAAAAAAAAQPGGGAAEREPGEVTPTCSAGSSSSGSSSASDSSSSSSDSDASSGPDSPRGRKRRRSLSLSVSRSRSREPGEHSDSEAGPPARRERDGWRRRTRTRSRSPAEWRRRRGSRPRSRSWRGSRERRSPRARSARRSYSRDAGRLREGQRSGGRKRRREASRSRSRSRSQGGSRERRRRGSRSARASPERRRQRTAEPRPSRPATPTPTAPAAPARPPTPPPPRQLTFAEAWALAQGGACREALGVEADIEPLATAATRAKHALDGAAKASSGGASLDLFARLMRESYLLYMRACVIWEGLLRGPDVPQAGRRRAKLADEGGLLPCTVGLMHKLAMDVQRAFPQPGTEAPRLLRLLAERLAAILHVRLLQVQRGKLHQDRQLLLSCKGAPAMTASGKPLPADGQGETFQRPSPTDSNASNSTGELALPKPVQPTQQQRTPGAPPPPQPLQHPQAARLAAAARPRSKPGTPVRGLPAAAPPSAKGAKPLRPAAKGSKAPTPPPPQAQPKAARPPGRDDAWAVEPLPWEIPASKVESVTRGWLLMQGVLSYTAALAKHGEELASLAGSPCADTREAAAMLSFLDVGLGTSNAGAALRLAEGVLDLLPKIAAQAADPAAAAQPPLPPGAG